MTIVRFSPREYNTIAVRRGHSYSSNTLVAEVATVVEEAVVVRAAEGRAVAKAGAAVARALQGCDP